MYEYKAINIGNAGALIITASLSDITTALRDITTALRDITAVLRDIVNVLRDTNDAARGISRLMKKIKKVKNFCDTKNYIIVIYNFITLYNS